VGAIVKHKDETEQLADASTTGKPHDKKGKKDKKNKKDKKRKKDKRSKDAAAALAATGDALTGEAGGPLTNKAYAKALKKLHVELVKLQEWVKHEGLKVCVIFEGRDGAGKGGTIKALTDRVSPRVFRVVALPAPTEREKSQMYLQRYIPHLPAAGEIVIFDRSWYNRAGVERVMGFTPEATVKRFLTGVPLVEKAIVDSGVILLKYWLEVSPEEQTRRLSARIDDGRKIWKLSPMDLKSYSRWYDYSRARDEMFTATDTGFAPWYVVTSDDKKRARLNLISHLLEQIPYQEVPREKVTLPKRQKPGDYVEPKYPYKHIPKKF
jgi:polyphosphate kinase 2